jgi:group I intron endonuclease
MAGVYLIRNVLNGKVYVGSSVDPSMRRARHFSALRHRRHHNAHLQNAWNAHGAEAFKFEIIEEAPIETLRECEQLWIDAYQASDENFGYNLAKSVEASFLGRTHSAETRAKMSAANKGKVRSAEQCARISAAQTGKTLSAEHRAKIGAGCRGLKMPPGHSARLVRLNIARIGQPLSAEHRAKLSASRIGNKNALGTKHSPEARAKMSAAHVGRKMPPRSVGWRAQHSAVMKLWWAAKRGAL